MIFKDKANVEVLIYISCVNVKEGWNCKEVFSARLTHNLNRALRADDARKGSEETATAFTVNKTSHNSRTKL